MIKLSVLFGAADDLVSAGRAVLGGGVEDGRNFRAVWVRGDRRDFEFGPLRRVVCD
jgi:hypothetical protein